MGVCPFRKHVSMPCEIGVRYWYPASCLFDMTLGKATQTNEEKVVEALQFWQLRAVMDECFDNLPRVRPKLSS